MNPQTPKKSPEEVVFSRNTGWIPTVIRKNGHLHLQLGAGADANHEPRTFVFPITDAHLEVIKTSLPRHLLLWYAVLPICEAAGTSDPFSDEAAEALLDPILFGSESEVEALFQENGWYTRGLISHHADIKLLEEGKLFAALKTATAEADSSLIREYNANQERASRGVILTPLDEGILKYTGQYIYRSGIPARKPEAVYPGVLPEVLKVIETADRAGAGREIATALDSNGRFTLNKEDWNMLSDTVSEALRKAYPTLVDDAVKTVSSLICSEAFARARKKAK